jgi:hypothetical protein
MATPTTGVSQLFGRVLRWGSALIGGIALVAGLLGWFIAGTDGLLSALVGAGMVLVFVSVTALSVSLGGKLPLSGFYGVVMGGWIAKFVLFIVVVGVLHKAPWVNGPVLFFTLVASIIGSLAIDSWLFIKARLPIEPQ